MAPYKTILIAGPTASGKSGLALKLAKQFNGVIINADSMQVYRDLRHLTARPTVEDEHLAAHRLYGVVDGSEAYSTGAWLRSVRDLIPGLRQEFASLIFVGGTGLYFNALTLGLSEIPEIPDSLRKNLRDELAERGPLALYAQLQAEDAMSAAALKPADGQRIVRALEVLRHTGRPLRDWQSEVSKPLIELDKSDTKAMVLTPDRSQLTAKIAERFAMMVRAGALKEVEALVGRHLDPQLPAMKAIGVAELASVVTRHASLETASALAIISSRQYAKRQATWFRGQMDTRWQRYATADLAELAVAEIISH